MNSEINPDLIKLNITEAESMANDWAVVYCNSMLGQRFDGEDPVGQAKAHVESLRDWGTTGHWKLTSPRTMPDSEGKSAVWRWCTDVLGETDYSVHWCRPATMVQEQTTGTKQENFYRYDLEQSWKDKYPYGRG